MAMTLGIAAMLFRDDAFRKAVQNLRSMSVLYPIKHKDACHVSAGSWFRNLVNGDMFSPKECAN